MVAALLMKLLRVMASVLLPDAVTTPPEPTLLALFCAVTESNSALLASDTCKAQACFTVRIYI